MNEKPLNQEFFDAPYEFRFFQAVRLLERMYPERSSVGRDNLPGTEVVRFRSLPTLRFPASEVYELRETSDDFTDLRKVEMFVNFMGMVGAVGVLPSHYTELVVERVRYRDETLWDFLDIFTHRAISLFFRAWEKYRFPIGYERVGRAGNQRGAENQSDDFTDFLFDFIGLGTRGLRGKLGLPDESLLPYAGLISNKPVSVTAIEQTVHDYFAIPVKVEQFFGQWLALDQESITQLGAVNSRLSVNAVVGTRIFDNQSKFRVRIGAVSFEKFRGFLPNGTAYKAICSLIRFLAGEEFDFDLQLILIAKEVPSCILTTRAKRRPQLGWSSYLKTQKFKHDDEQVILQTDN
ncbi:MAG: type VI secretion system baseplate subunit TssG [Pyrinomonadaceae bacterium]